MVLGTRGDGLIPQDVQSALWRDRTLIKTWAIRATLHLISASELPLYVAARSLFETRNWLSYFTFFGLLEGELETVEVEGWRALALGETLATMQQLEAADSVRLCSEPTTPIKKGIEAEAERLSAFLNTSVMLEYVSR